MRGNSWWPMPNICVFRLKIHTYLSSRDHFRFRLQNYYRIWNTAIPTAESAYRWHDSWTHQYVSCVFFVLFAVNPLLFKKFSLSMNSVPFWHMYGVSSLFRIFRRSVLFATHINKDTTNICSHITTDSITHRYTIIDFFNKVCNFSNHGWAPRRWCDCTETCRSYFDVNFNIVLRTITCAFVGE
jgi:hypothetical protein